MNSNIKEYLSNTFNIPTDLVNLINKFHGTLLCSDFDNDDKPLVSDKLKVYISPTDNFFIIKNIDIINLQCIYSRNLACECYLWQYINNRYRHYIQILHKRKRAIFSYILNENIYIFKFLKDNYFDHCLSNSFEPGNVICNCNTCEKLTNKLNKLKKQNSYCNYSNTMIGISSIRNNLSRKLRLKNFIKIFSNPICLPSLDFHF